jgi:hypothetical protein
MTDIVEAVEKDIEEVFTAKPGGLVDRHRQNEARRQEAQRERENADERVEEPSYKAVKTTQLSPTIFSINVITIPPGGNAQILPFSPYRYRAVLTVNTTGKSVILAKDGGAAIGGVGFPLANGAQPFPVFARAQLYGFNPDVAAITVAVIAELYAPEQ